MCVVAGERAGSLGLNKAQTFDKYNTDLAKRIPTLFCRYLRSWNLFATCQTSLPISRKKHANKNANGIHVFVVAYRG